MPNSLERPDQELLQLLSVHLFNSPLAVIGWDAEFRVAFWSGQAQEVFGWTEEEVRGKHPGDWRFVHEEDWDSVARVMESLLAGAQPRNISANRNYTRSGDVVHCEWYNSVLTDENGDLLSILSLVQDVTERETMEAQLRHLQKMESIGHLTGGLAHDFNNLLTVILGYGDLLVQQEGDADPDEVVETARAIVEAAQRGAELTHQLLAFARQQPLMPRAVDVSELLSRMEDLLARTLEENTEIRVGGTEEVWPARVDPGQLESAILNLCLNARDAMPGGGSLTLEWENVRIGSDTSSEELAPGDYVLVAVSDTGRGISDEVLENVFDPFFTTKEVGRGSGLGLSMVYGFVKQSGGHIHIYSEVGEGTTVRVYLPRAQEEDAPDQEAAGGEPHDLQEGSERILVVEDDPMVRQYAAIQLGALGYHVRVAGDAPEALELLEAGEPFDLLFTDVVMPGGMDGVELARRARELRPGLPVLHTSGYSTRAFQRRGSPTSSSGFLPKPYRRIELASRVRAILDEGQGG